MSSFHYDFILSKRSSLARVWLAAHWEKKLSKVQIFETNLQSIVQDILHPQTPIALRTSSHLLVGVVRIYSRKAKYLLKDCSDTLVNIKVAFRPGVSCLGKSAKRRKSVKEMMDCPLFITEKVGLLDQWIPEISVVELDCTLNQSKVEEITLREEPMKVSSLEDYFDDEGFGEMDNDSSDATEKTLNNCTSILERVASFADSAYGTDDHILGDTVSDYYSDPFSSTLTPVKDFGSPSKRTLHQLPKLLLDQDNELHPEQNQSLQEHCLTPPLEEPDKTAVTEDTLELGQISSFEDETEPGELQDNLSTSRLGFEKEGHNLKRSFEAQDDVLILDPVEFTPKKAQSSRKRLKRKLLIDEVISIERGVIFDNLSNPARLLKQPVVAASTKQRMKQNGRNQSLLSNASFLELSPALDKLLLDPKPRKFSTDASSETVDLKPASAQKRNLSETGFESSEDLFDNGLDMNDDSLKQDELDLSEQFIPLQDVEYSSDEECPVGTDRFEYAMNEFDFDQDTTEGTVIDENISEDKFCSFVETKVLHSRPEVIKLQQVLGSYGGKLTRKTVAQRFLKCLLMQRDARLNLEQAGSFKEILLHPGLKHVSEEGVGEI